jgi:hypothetical protein
MPRGATCVSGQAEDGPGDPDHRCGEGLGHPRWAVRGADRSPAVVVVTKQFPLDPNARVAGLQRGMPGPKVAVPVETNERWMRRDRILSRVGGIGSDSPDPASRASPVTRPGESGGCLALS